VNLSFFGHRQDEDGKPVMVVPFIKDTDDWRKHDLVKATCRKCAEQLAGFLYRWAKSWPALSTIKTWDDKEQRFLGMDLSLLQEFIMASFSVRTPDNREWLLDRNIAALIWAECIADESPLPPASWAVESNRKTEAKV